MGAPSAGWRRGAGGSRTANTPAATLASTTTSTADLSRDTTSRRQLAPAAAGTGPRPRPQAAPPPDLLPAPVAAVTQPISSRLPGPPPDPSTGHRPAAAYSRSATAAAASTASAPAFAAPASARPFEDVLTLHVPQVLARGDGASSRPASGSDGRAHPLSRATPGAAVHRGSSAATAAAASATQSDALPRIALSELPDVSPRTAEHARRPRSRSSMASTTPLSDAPSESDADARASNGDKASVLRERQIAEALGDAPGSLPAEKGFPIQIGSELFRLSGASIMSDAPSYFSRFFEEQLRHSAGDSSIKTLYIDRDPVTFQDIALHLQGYSAKPRDGAHYVKLFADAQFYGLPRLIKQLFETDICIRIGEGDFVVPRDLFSAPGNAPNYFTLGFAMFAPASGEVFPGLERENLFRPPSIEAPTLLGRSADTFRDILALLRGYPLHIRDAEHRAALLRDCRYYHFKGLEQMLVPHSVSYNATRQRHEIAMRLEDIRQSGVSFAADVSPAERSPLSGWVNYARPYVDDSPRELLLEIGDEATRIDLRHGRAEFSGQAKARITSLFQVVATKMNLPSTAPLGLMLQAGGVSGAPVSPGNTPLSDDLVKVRVDADAHVILDGDEYDGPPVGAPSAAFPDAASSSGADTRSVASDAPTAGGASGTGSGGGGGGGGGVGSATAGGGATGTPTLGAAALGRSAAASPEAGRGPPPRKRRRRGSLDDFGEWVVRRGLWRLRVQPRPDQDEPTGQLRMEIVLLAVKLDALSGQRGRNARTAWLGE